MQLRWFHQFQFAGYYAAKDKGFYREAGMEATLAEGGGGKDVIREVLEGRADYGVANSEILLHRLKKKPLVVLAAIFQHSPIAFVVRRDSGITNPQELIGKRVKMSKTSRDIELQAIFQNEGISPDRLRIIDGFASHEDYFDETIDAVAAYVTNQPFYLKQKGIPFSLIQPATYGIDFYGDCLFTTEQELEEHPERVEAFRKASLKGWEYAMKHPGEVIEIIMADYSTKKSGEHLRYEAEAMRGLILPELVEIGHINPGRWRHIADTFARFDLAEPEYDFGKFLYDPNPRPDYTWLYWTIGIALALVSLGGVAVAILVVANRRLSLEVAERKKAERNLKKANEQVEAAYRLKTQFLANVSHEIRTPLNSIIGFLSLFMEDGSISEEKRKNLSIAHESSKSLLGIVNDILDVSKLETEQLGLEKIPFDLTAMIKETIRPFHNRAAAKGLVLESEIDGSVPRHIVGDPARLKQILANLVGNAVKFTKAGKITVSVEPGDEADMLCFAVKDTGIGIPPDRLDKIFEPFVQVDGSTARKFGGTGLGTAISKRLVELMGGQIYAESEEGKGSVFHFTILAEPADTAPEEPTENAVSVSCRPGTLPAECVEETEKDGGPLPDETALKEMFDGMLASFEEYNPKAVEPFIEKLDMFLSSRQLEPIKQRVESFDFEEARHETLKLAADLGIGMQLMQ